MDFFKKNKGIMIPEKIEKSLQEWSLPPSSASDVFKRRGFFSSSPDPEAKTVEKQIPLKEGYTRIPLISPNLGRKTHGYLHVGMIKVGLKPAKLGSNTSAIICLRDQRLLKFNESVLGMVESSLCDGPIYFTYFPSHCVYLSDGPRAFTLDIKAQGSGEDEGMILMYRLHYKVMESHNPDTKNLSRIVDGIGETTLFATDVARGNRVVSRKIYWNEVAVPEKWKEKAEEWKETAEGYVLEVDVLGLKKEEVKVEVEGGRVVVIGLKAAVGRSIGKFPRRLRLPENARSEQVEAVINNGVLMVMVAKEEAGKKVEVEVVDISR